MSSESVEQRKSRRWRWLTLAELLAVAAVTVSALTLWDNHNNRAREREERMAAASRATTEATMLVLRGTPDRNGERISLTPARDGQAIQAQTIAFPKALDTAPVDTAGNSRIEGGWFADGLKKTLKAASRDNAARGDERMPVLILTRYLVDGETFEDRAIYDVGIELDRQFLSGSRVRLRGLSLVSRVKGEDGQRRLDRRWATLHPSTDSTDAN